MDASLPATLMLARDAGVSTQRLDRDSALQRIRPGVYVRADTWLSLPQWERYLLRVHAVAQTWSSPVFCLESAAVQQGLPLFGEPRDIHLLSTDGRSWREGDVIVHGSQDDRELVSSNGLLITAPAETAVDLCRVLPPACALAVADAALRALRTRGRTLAVGEHGRSQANRRGLRRLDWVQARATPAAESPGESVSRAVIEWLGYEGPELQREFHHEGARDRCDFFWTRQRVVGESDGYGKYDAEDVDAARTHFIREKTREDRLRRHVAGFVRWDWSDAMRWRPLDAKLRAANLTPAYSMHGAMLATLASNPRSMPPSRNRASPQRPKATSSLSA